ncbi:MAG: hypothetical protein U0517_02185 [Candidatus Andersenbacteria bacterium]
MEKSLNLTTLVFSALPLRSAIGPSVAQAGKPWLGLHDGIKWYFKKTLSTYRPGRVNFWKLLIPYKRRLPPDAILVVTSPGPFSATRASVSIANALAFAWDIPVVPVSIEQLRRTTPMLLAKKAGVAKRTGFSLARRALPQYNRKPY